MSITISSGFDGGNGELVSVEGDVVNVRIRPDHAGPWFQWFYFAIHGAKGRPLKVRLINAGQSAYPDGWPGYRACVRDGGDEWLRTDTTFDGEVLEIAYTPQTDVARFAYFAPYDQSRLKALLDEAARLRHTVGKLGWTVQSRSIWGASFGAGPKQIWILCRQHAGETMASWWAEGAFERLAPVTPDPVAARLLSKATIHIVPCVNVDGAAHGHLRGNVAGLDLNRQWANPDPKTAPEVVAILEAMDRTGVHLMLDVHGDETLPHVFVDGSDADPASTPKQNAGVEAFKKALLAACPAFQTAIGYPVTYGGVEAPGMATRAIAARYGCVGLTLEMPFKDSLEVPDPVLGWSSHASRQLAKDCITALDAIIDEI
jgi:murein tripeptide amidase MpaA